MMSHRRRRRFEEVRLGQQLDPVAAAGAATIAEAAHELVMAWSGSAAADIISCGLELRAPCGGPLAGRVIARHLDGSRQVAVEVCDASGPARAAHAVVRVALA